MYRLPSQTASEYGSRQSGNSDHWRRGNSGDIGASRQLGSGQRPEGPRGLARSRRRRLYRLGRCRQLRGSLAREAPSSRTAKVEARKFFQLAGDEYKDKTLPGAYSQFAVRLNS